MRNSALVAAVLFLLIFSACRSATTSPPGSAAETGSRADAAPTAAEARAADTTGALTADAAPAAGETVAAEVRPAERDTQPLVSQCPFAVLVPGQNNDSLPAMKKRIKTAVRLGAEFVLLPPMLQLRGRALIGGGTAVTIDDDSVLRLLVPWDTLFTEEEHLRFLSRRGRSAVAALRAGGGPGERAAALAEVRSLLSADSMGNIVVLLDAPYWDAEPLFWQKLSDSVRGRVNTLFVAFTEETTFSWNQEEGVSYLNSPNMADGDFFSGLLWIVPNQAETQVSLVEQVRLTDLQSFRRDVLENRRALRQTLSATPLCGDIPSTTVTLQNPTAFPLSFRTNWRFRGGEAHAVPEILGFTLQPEEVFQQTFVLNSRSAPLKFLMPSFELETELPGDQEAGSPEPVRMSVAPWTCIRGEIVRLLKKPLFDGDPEDWGRAGHLLGHASQVIKGQEKWTGAGDLSANLYVGRTDDRLYIGVRVFDDELTDQIPEQSEFALELLVDPRTMAEAEEEDFQFRAESSPIRLLIREDGTYTVLNDAEGLEVVALKQEKGVSAEIRLPLSLFAPWTADSAVLLDFALYDAHRHEDAGKVLFFSGNLAGLQSSKLYSVFKLGE